MTSTKSELQSLIPLEDIQNIKVIVTEEITQKNLNNFLIAQCKIHNIHLASNLFIYPIFHPNLMEYDIYYFTKNEPSITIISAILTQHKDIITTTTTVSYQITQDAITFYILFHNGFFHSLHQAESSIPSSLILESLQQKYALDSITTQLFAPASIELTSITSDELFFKLYKETFYKFYFSYLAILIVCFGLFEVQKYQHTTATSSTSETPTTNLSLYQKLSHLTNFLQSNELDISQINYHNNELYFHGKLVKIDDLRKLHHPTIELMSSTIDQTNPSSITYKAKFHP